MINNLWNRLGNIQKKLVVIVSIISSVAFLYPRVVSFIKTAKEYQEAIVSIPETKKAVDNLADYIMVINGILKANMENIDGEFYVKVNGKQIPVELRRADSKDINVFVADGMVGVYSIHFNFDRDKVTYFDFNGKYYEIDGDYTINEDCVILINGK